MLQDVHFQRKKRSRTLGAHRGHCAENEHSGQAATDHPGILSTFKKPNGPAFHTLVDIQ